MYYRRLTSNFLRHVSCVTEFGNFVVVQNFDLSSAKLDDALSSLWQWQIDGERAGVVTMKCCDHGCDWTCDVNVAFNCFPVSWFDNQSAYCHSVWQCFDLKISVSSLSTISCLEYTFTICGLTKHTWKWIKSFKLLLNSFGIEFSSKF